MKFTFEESGKSIEDALRKVEEKSGISRERLRYEVIEEKKGFLKSLFGSNHFTVKGEYEKFEDIRELAEDVLKNVLKHMKMLDSSTIRLNESEKHITFNIESPHERLLIGKDGATLDALRYIVNHITAQKMECPDKKRIIIDIEGYNEKRNIYLSKMANNLIKRVKATRKPHTMKPLCPRERKLVYKIAEKDRAISAKSFGNGYYKRINISLKNAKNSKQN